MVDNVSKIKVCHITSAHNSDDIRIFHKECASLAKAGYDTYLVAKGESREEKGVHVVGVGPAPSSRLKRMALFSNMIYRRALAINADIYHLHDPELLPYGVKLKKQGKKVIFDSHERYLDQIKAKSYLPKYLRGFISFIYGRYENWVLNRLDAVIFPCTLDGVHPFYKKCRRTETLDNYPLLDEFYRYYDPSICKTPNSICYIGSLTHNRGITSLVSAMDKTDGTLFLAGKFSPSDYEDFLNKLPGWSKVCYLGSLSRDRVRDLLLGTLVGASAILNVGQYNKYDNLPTKAYEYMSLGLPVILTRAPYNEYVNQKYHFGICVNPEDSDELASAISYLFCHPQEARQMGLNGRRAVKHEFNWGTQEKKLLELYDKIR